MHLEQRHHVVVSADGPEHFGLPLSALRVGDSGIGLLQHGGYEPTHVGVPGQVGTLPVAIAEKVLDFVSVGEDDPWLKHCGRPRRSPRSGFFVPQYGAPTARSRPRRRCRSDG